MIRLSHRMAVAIGGCVWLIIGAYLLILGLRFLEACALPGAYTPLLSSFQDLVGGRDNGLIVLIVIAMVIGQIKGRKVMEKAAGREVNRIASLPNPLPLTHLYSGRFYILMGIMMCLGMSMNLFGIPLDIRGTIDATVGIALFRGALAYFKQLPTAVTA